MSSIRTPLTVIATERLGQLVNRGKLVPEGAVPAAGLIPSDGERLTSPSLDVREDDRNPRQSLNPLHDETMESARARRGLSLGDLTVMWRPGRIDDMVCGGGNTRQRMIHELARELSARRPRVWPLSQAV
jgi:hypothetical protein